MLKKKKKEPVLFLLPLLLKYISFNYFVHQFCFFLSTTGHYLSQVFFILSTRFLPQIFTQFSLLPGLTDFFLIL